jgi:hypothetical protein
VSISRKKILSRHHASRINAIQLHFLAPVDDGSAKATLCKDFGYPRPQTGREMGSCDRACVEILRYQKDNEPTASLASQVPYVQKALECPIRKLVEFTEFQRIRIVTTWYGGIFLEQIRPIDRSIQ